MKMRNRNIFITLFLLPSIILFLIFFLIPLVEVFVTSFCKWSFGDPLVFIGLKNYTQLFVNNPDFRDALFHTLLWIILTVGIQIPFSLLVALVLIKKPIGWNFTRNAFVLPNIISSAAIGMLFMNIMDSDYGIINALIRIFNKDFNINWLQEERTAFLAVTLSWILFAGTNVLLIMSEIASVPESVLESARIDGANKFQIDLFIIIPMLRNIIGTVTVLVSSFAITEFSEVYILTRGGPGTATLNLGVYLFKSAMIENNYGLANSVGVIQMLLGMLTILFITKVLKLGKSYV